MHKADAGWFSFDDRLHQWAPDTTLLNVRRNGDRSNPSDEVSLIKEVGADDPPVYLRHDTEDGRMIDE